jgi:hypothetical protein
MFLLTSSSSSCHITPHHTTKHILTSLSSSWYLFLADGESIPIHFDYSPANTAVYEQGGPIQRQITASGAGTAFDHHHNTNEQHASEIPNSGNGAHSGIAKDLHLNSIKALGRKATWGKKDEEGTTNSSGSV